jgi:hypothetical protein
MFGLVRFLTSLALFAAFIWFAISVPLGKRTLVGHLRAIAGSEEAQDLAHGTKQEAEKVVKKLDLDLHPPQDLAAPTHHHVREALPVDKHTK